MQRTLTQLVLVLAICAGVSAPVSAQTPESDQQLRATVLRLIDSLVDAGILTRAKADELIRASATPPAAATLAQAASASPTSPAPTAGPELGADGKRIVRVPYVPDSLKREMRDSIRQDVLAQARTERWGEAGALPDWLARIKIDGDVRVRADATRLSKDNTPSSELGQILVPNGPGDLRSVGLTRAVDITSASSGRYLFNTQDEADRARVRLRLNVESTVTDGLKAGVRLSTGNTTDRVSTNQTLGQNFNKYSVLLDRVFLGWNPPGSENSYFAGRMPNPFFGTDLVWDPDLNFEGLAATSDLRLGLRERAFATVGWFPLTAASPGSIQQQRDLIGAQVGLDWRFGYTAANRLRVGFGVYNYRNMAGELQTADALENRPEYVSGTEYPSGLRQRGNTLFRLNNPNDPRVNSATQYYGLASDFRTLNLTAVLDLVDAAALPVSLTADYLENLKFKPDEIRARSGQSITDGSGRGYMLGLHLGKRSISNRGDWSTSIAYRRLGSDATLDAFADSDFGLGGTNNKGTVLTLSYGLDRNVWASMRWLSSDLIDRMALAPNAINIPTSSPPAAPPNRFSVDVLHLDLNARF
jgi:hypothetical protein